MKMSRKYEKEDDVLDLVRAFEDASIPRDEWTHAEHLIVALYYVSHHDVDTAIEKMRTGILNLLAYGFKVDLGKEMPYHETITVFWIRTVAAFDASSKGKPLGDKIREIVNTLNKDHIFSCYTRELLVADEARRGFITGDIQRSK